MGYSRQFSPENGNDGQELEAFLGERSGGWYSVRIYTDPAAPPVESLPFRFMKPLKSLTIKADPALPSSSGHRTAEVIFKHTPECCVRFVGDHGKPPDMERGEESTRVSIPSDPEWDATNWIVKSDDRYEVDARVLVERVWWCIASEGSRDNVWQDKPVALTRDDFRVTHRKALRLRLPCPRWTDAVEVGFERHRSRPYTVPVESNEVVILLGDFSDHAEVMDPTKDAELAVWVGKCGGRKATVATLAAERRPHKGAVSLSKGVGRSKTTVAVANVVAGSGRIAVEKKDIWEYFDGAPTKARRFLRRLLGIPRIKEILQDEDIVISVKGSGPNTMRQPKAVAHAIARALASHEKSMKRALQREGFWGAGIPGNWSR
jgi:small subunit ribosomal protein S9